MAAGERESYTKGRRKVRRSECICDASRGGSPAGLPSTGSSAKSHAISRDFVRFYAILRDFQRFSAIFSDFWCVGVCDCKQWTTYAFVFTCMSSFLPKQRTCNINLVLLTIVCIYAQAPQSAHIRIVVHSHRQPHASRPALLIAPLLRP